MAETCNKYKWRVLCIVSFISFVLYVICGVPSNISVVKNIPDGWLLFLKLALPVCLILLGVFFGEKAAVERESWNNLNKYGVKIESHLRLSGDDLKTVLKKLNPSKDELKAIYELGAKLGPLSIRHIDRAIQDTAADKRHADFIQTLNKFKPDASGDN